MTPIPEAALADILTNPADDTPRMILADWLDDHEEPGRAEFIRVQCQLAKLPPRRPVLPLSGIYQTRGLADMGVAEDREWMGRCLADDAGDPPHWCRPGVSCEVVDGLLRFPDAQIVGIERHPAWRMATIFFRRRGIADPHESLRLSLEHRQHELLAGHAVAWSGGADAVLCRTPGDVDCTTDALDADSLLGAPRRAGLRRLIYRRGFIAKLICRLPDFLNLADALLWKGPQKRNGHKLPMPAGVQPIEEVEFTEPGSIVFSPVSVHDTTGVRDDGIQLDYRWAIQVHGCKAFAMCRRFVITKSQQPREAGLRKHFAECVERERTLEGFLHAGWPRLKFTIPFFRVISATVPTNEPLDLSDLVGAAPPRAGDWQSNGNAY